MSKIILQLLDFSFSCHQWGHSFNGCVSVSFDRVYQRFWEGAYTENGFNMSPKQHIPYARILTQHILKMLIIILLLLLWPSSVVSIATAYGLDGPGIESRWERDFPHLSRPALRPNQPHVQWVPGLSRGKERPGRGADSSPPSSAEVKIRVELYPYSP